MYNENKKSQGRKPVWMNDRALAALRRKKKAYDKYLRSRDGKDYIEYVKFRNTAKSEVKMQSVITKKTLPAKPRKTPKPFTVM